MKMYLEVIFAQAEFKLKIYEIPITPTAPQPLILGSEKSRRKESTACGCTGSFLQPEDEKQAEYQGVMLSSNLRYPLF